MQTFLKLILSKRGILSIETQLVLLNAEKILWKFSFWNILNVDWRESLCNHYLRYHKETVAFWVFKGYVMKMIRMECRSIGLQLYKCWQLCKKHQCLFSKPFYFQIQINEEKCAKYRACNLRLLLSVPCKCFTSSFTSVAFPRHKSCSSCAWPRCISSPLLIILYTVIYISSLVIPTHIPMLQSRTRGIYNWNKVNETKPCWSSWLWYVSDACFRCR